MMAHLLVGVALAIGQAAPSPAANAPATESAAPIVPPEQTASPAEILFPFAPAASAAASSIGASSGNPALPDSGRRGLPAPLDSPPFPSADWQGLPLIGIREDTGEQFLMRNLQGTFLGDWLLTNRIKIYGWIDVGGNLSTSNKSNFPVAYDVFPNTVYLDQANLRFERVLDTEQTDHLDWGFKWDNLYGIDYRYTTAEGILSDQLLKHNQSYGYDPVQFYGDLYIPGAAEGLVLKVGRWVSPPDIEAELSLENYIHTHSLTYAYDPYTQFGLQATLRLSPQWIVQASIISVNDLAPWEPHNQPTGEFGVRWVSMDNNDSVFAVLNSINDGRYIQVSNHDNLQDVVATWSHKFSDDVHTMTEVWYMWQLDAELGGTENDGEFKTYGGPSGGGAGPIIPGVSNEIAAVNYTEFRAGHWDYFTIRNEFFADLDGQRTGYKTQYSTHTIGWCHYINQTPDVQFRPEISYDRSYNVPAFNDGTRKNQFLLAADILFRF
jgi:hypothetical protein